MKYEHNDESDVMEF